MRLFIRFHYIEDISLKNMQKKCNESNAGLCCIERHKFQELKNFMVQVMNEGDTGEIICFEGDVWGTCLEGYTAYPVKIIKRQSIICKIDKNGYKEIYPNQN